MLNRLDTDAVQRDIKALRDAGAEYIIAYNHSGTEYSQVPVCTSGKASCYTPGKCRCRLCRDLASSMFCSLTEKLPIGDKNTFPCYLLYG